MCLCSVWFSRLTKKKLKWWHAVAFVFAYLTWSNADSRCSYANETVRFYKKSRGGNGRQLKEGVLHRQLRATGLSESVTLLKSTFKLQKMTNKERGKKKYIIRDIVSQKKERQQVLFYKEKKKTFLETWALRKKRLHMWNLVQLEGRSSDFFPFFVSVAVGKRFFIIFLLLFCIYELFVIFALGHICN